MPKARYKRFVVAFDNHGDAVDDSAERAFFDFLKHFKPDLRVHGGDAIDFRAWRNGASKEEKNESMKADVERGVDFLAKLKPDVWVMGNHDYRIHRVIQGDTDGNKRQLAGMLWDRIVDAIPRTQIVPYGKRNFYQLGNHKVVHGYHCGIYAARQAAQCYGNVIMGHVHRPAYEPSAHIDGVEGYSSGCLCKLDMDYNLGHANTMSQAHGWAYGFVLPSGHTIVHLAKKVGGTWLYPTEFRSLSA